ncbi:MAG TPA: ISKra4 family transposase, partial [Egibacteraceae bacterium]|nr:ISKra4 family transposase [Egibacteraceae bacterium]
MLDWLDSADAGALAHAELEERLETTGRELVRQMFQDHLDVRAQRETRVEVTDVHGATHGAVEAGHVRGLH